MNKLEKTAIVRIATDLIKADSVIDNREIAILNQIKENFHIKKEHLCSVKYMTFSDAVRCLIDLDKEEKKELLKVFESIALTDKICNRNEALLMMALTYSLKGDYEVDMMHIQIPQQGALLDNSHVIYVESEYDETINSTIKQNYHQIENALRLAGFDFTYIPYIAQTYNETPNSLFNDVISFLSPDLHEKEIAEIKDKITNMTTVKFCKDLLCKKLNLMRLSDTYPALLFKVGESVLESNIYANFLKIVLEKDVVEEIKEFLYKFTSMMNAEFSILKNVYNSTDRFIYSGTYKQIIDLCLMRENNTSRILLDTMKQEILLPDINEKLDISRSEKALYALCCIESLSGGINFNSPSSCEGLNTYNARMKKIMKKYAKAYHHFGGNCEKTPNIFDPSIRNPKISKINKIISSLNKKLPYYKEYLIAREDNGLYKINLDNQKIFSNDTNIMQSKLWQEIITL